MKIKFLFLFASTVLITPSCNDDFLDVKPQDKYSDAAVWSDPVLAQAFVNNIYQGLPYPFFTLMLSSAVDESMATWDWETSNITKSVLTSSYLASFDPGFWTGGLRFMTWNTMYKNIRACNLFFEKVEEVPFENEEEKQHMIGQVTFLRAYFYHQLLSFYGGVPIITKAYSASDDFSAARNTFEESVNFIAEECDKAAALLPEGGNKAYATKGAALSLKSRILLYAASDLYNTNGSWASGYAHPELISYTSGSQTQRWTAAKNAAKAVIDLRLYSLYGTTSPATPEEASENFGNLFLNDGNEEDIFLQFHDVLHNTNWDGPHPGLFNGPNGYHNWGGNTPTGQLADAFERIDGSKFDWNNPTHAAAPYENRDPRFYASILYEGAKWRPRPADVVAADREGRIQVGTYKRVMQKFPDLIHAAAPLKIGMDRIQDTILRNLLRLRSTISSTSKTFRSEDLDTLKFY